MGPSVPILHKFLWGALILLLSSVLGVAVVSEIRKRRPEMPLPAFVPPHDPEFDPKKGPELIDFSLIDQLNRKVSRADFVGKVWVADFIFTRCAGPCPAMTAHMAELQRDLPKDVLLVSFSVDPYDTPEVLQKYGERQKADPERWRLLTGDQEVIFKVAKGLCLTAEGATVKDINHSTRFVLLGRDGSVSGTYLDSDEESMERLRQEAMKRVKP